MREKNSLRLEWPTGTITEITTSKDGLVRRVIVQPHPRAGKSTTETPRERAIHDLVLARSLTESEPPAQLDVSTLDEKEAEQVLKTTHCWEQILQEETDFCLQKDLEQGIADLQQSTDATLDMIRQIRRLQEARQSGDNTERARSVSGPQQIEQPVSFPDRQTHRYRSTKPHLLAALESTELYFRHTQQQTRPQRNPLAERTESAPIPQDSIATDATEPVSTNLRSVLQNRHAVHTENICRKSSDKALEVITKLNTTENGIRDRRLLEEEQSFNRISPGSPNRKRIVIREQANTVRAIPSANNGERQGKRWTTEPTWLDRYKMEGNEQEEDTDDEDEVDLAEMHSWLRALRSK